MYHDTTYILHIGKKEDMSVIATFQDQELFVQEIKKLPEKAQNMSFVSCFINNAFYPSPLVDSMPMQDYINSVI